MGLNERPTVTWKADGAHPYGDTGSGDHGRVPVAAAWDSGGHHVTVQNSKKPSNSSGRKIRLELAPR